MAVQQLSLQRAVHGSYSSMHRKQQVHAICSLLESGREAVHTTPFPAAPAPEAAGRAGHVGVPQLAVVDAFARPVLARLIGTKDVHLGGKQGSGRVEQYFKAHSCGVPTTAIAAPASRAEGSAGRHWCGAAAA